MIFHKALYESEKEILQSCECETLKQFSFFNQFLSKKAAEETRQEKCICREIRMKYKFLCVSIVSKYYEEKSFWVLQCVY